MPREDTLRLFFALPCPAEQAVAITRWRDGQFLGGDSVPLENLHLTLAFLGSQPAERLPALLQLAESVHVEGFELSLNQLVTLDQNYICLAPGKSPPALMQLAASLAERLGTLGIALDPRPFLPHLTLTRQAHAPLQGATPTFYWPARDFGLYLSHSVPGGVRYQSLGNWPLLPAPDAPT